MPYRRDKIVGGQGLAHLNRADVKGRHTVGFQPDAHGKGTGPQDIRTLNTGDGREPRLHHTNQVVGYLVLLQDV